MRLTPIALGIALAYGRQRDAVESAAWLWFEWTRHPKLGLSYRWRP